MTTQSSHRSNQRSGKIISKALISETVTRLAAGRRVHVALPGKGFVHIEGHQPFLIVYRVPKSPDAGTRELVVNESAYLIAKHGTRGLANLVSSIAQTQCAQFGAFLLVEIWAGAARLPAGGRQRFRIHIPKDYRGSFGEAVQRSLSRMNLGGRIGVEVRRSRGRTASTLVPDGDDHTNWLHIGIEVEPAWRDQSNGHVYPKELRTLVREFAHALRSALHEFACHHANHCPIDYRVLGRTALPKAVWRIDQQLAEVADQFDLLLQVTPVNAHEAWLEFRGTGFTTKPMFHYRSLSADPIVLKRRLFSIPVERVHDPAFAELFREKVVELDREISMLSDIETPQFIHGSLQLFGGVGAKSKELAEQILNRVAKKSRDDFGTGYLEAEAFAAKARDEIAYYRAQDPQLSASVQVRRDVSSGLMVSRGNLLIGHESRIPRKRADALLQHEIGTHVLTYHNGRAQPLRQLYSGLAGYDVLQEGLAVFAEYLVGGLSRPRLRLLAARVVGASMMIEGASFADVYHVMHGVYGFSQRVAFTITVRLYRGGGLTKDAMYLDGLGQVFEFVREGGDLETLMIGKFAMAHIAIMRELRLREVLLPPRLTPRYLGLEGVRGRLEKVRRGLVITELIQH